MTRTAIFKDKLFLEHDPGYGHVESPARLKIIYDVLEKPEIKRRFVFPEFSPVTREIIALNHKSAMIDQIAATAGRPFSSLDGDTSTSPRSYEAACLAAGALVAGVKLLVSGEIDNGFALVRPPGHHAENDRAMGFCLFNNVAIGARFAIEKLGLKRVLIVDWDLHHGNGTQHSFYDTDKVLYFSTHQYPYYPGSGAVSETGRGKGRGHTVNVPLFGGLGDAQYARVFNEILTPLARQYQPQLILVSAGFDIAMGDPLGAMQVTSEGFAYLARVLTALAAEICEGRLLFTLEGGYDLEAQLNGVLAVLTVLQGGDYPRKEVFKELAESQVPLAVTQQVRGELSSYWNI